MAVSVVPNAVIMMMGSFGLAAWSCPTTSRPDRPGIFKSVITTSHGSFWAREFPSSPRRGDEGNSLAQKEPWDVVITDLKMPGLSGLDVVGQLHAAKPKLPIIMMTAFGTTETAIEATKLGAYDYLLKPFDMAELLDLIAKAVACNRLMSEPVVMGDVGKESSATAIIGESRAMQAVYKEIGRVA